MEGRAIWLLMILMAAPVLAEQPATMPLANASTMRGKIISNDGVVLSGSGIAHEIVGVVVKSKRSFRGKGGLEEQLDPVLADGQDMRISLNIRKQKLLQDALDGLVEKAKAELAIGIIITSTGSIRAVSQAAKAGQKVPKVTAAIDTTYSIRPIFRLASAAWAADRGIISPADIQKVLSFDMNLNNLTDKQIAHMYFDMGMMSPTGIDLPGEKIFKRHVRYADFQITPLQAIVVFNSFFNGGTSGAPHFVDSAGRNIQLLDSRTAEGVMSKFREFDYGGGNECLITSTAADMPNSRQLDIADSWLFCKIKGGDTALVLLHGAAIGQLDASDVLIDYARNGLKQVSSAADTVR